MIESSKNERARATTTGRRLSVVDLSAYELRFYVPLADQVLERRGAVVDAALRSRHGPVWRKSGRSLGKLYVRAVDEALAAEACSGRRLARQLGQLKSGLIEFHRGVELALDATLARAMLWGRTLEREAAERLDKGLRRALSSAKKEAREASASTDGAKRLARLLVEALEG